MKNGVIIALILLAFVGCQKTSTFKVVNVSEDSQGCFIVVKTMTQRDTIRSIHLTTANGDVYDCKKFLSMRDTIIGRNIVVMGGLK